MSDGAHFIAALGPTLLDQGGIGLMVQSPILRRVGRSRPIGKLAEGGDVGIEVRAKIAIRARVGFQPASKAAAGGGELVEGRQSPRTLTPFDRKESLG